MAKKIPPTPTGFSQKVIDYLGQTTTITVHGLDIEMARDPQDVRAIGTDAVQDAGPLNMKIFGHIYKWLNDMVKRGEIEGNGGSLHGARYWTKK